MNHNPPTDQQLDEIRAAVAASFDQHEPAESRQARWENAAWAAGREVDRNALRAYMAVADAEQSALADAWARSVAASDAQILRLKDRVRELERPIVEAERAKVRDSFAELIAAAEETKDFEGAFDIECRLREREEQWKREDAATPAPAVSGGEQ